MVTADESFDAAMATRKDADKAAVRNGIRGLLIVDLKLTTASMARHLKMARLLHSEGLDAEATALADYVETVQRALAALLAGPVAP